MVNMENAEEVMQILERFTRLKQKEIPKELDEYLQYVAKTGDTVFKWSSLKYLFREKLLNVMKHFHDTTPHVIEIPQYPNVDPFNYESMKSSLLERLELFNAAPFTIQRLCELLIDPRKQYSRIDKFMRALEKNILVVSTIEPGRKRTESENGDSLDSVVNGDLSLDVNVDIDMENESLFNVEAQNGNGSSATVADIAAAAVAAAAAAESESDTCAIAASAEVKERALVTESPNVPHTADDDILPNPKKPKLDLEVEIAEAAAAAEAEADAVLAADTQIQAKSIAAEPEKQVDAADVDMQEKEENKENLDASEKHTKVEEIPAMKEKPTADEQEKSVALEKKQDKEKKVAETDKIESEDNSANALDASVDDKPPLVEQEETEVDAAIKVDAEKKAAGIVKDVVVGEEEKIVEKQEIEMGEKLQRTQTEKKEAEEELPVEQTAVEEQACGLEVKQPAENKDKKLITEKKLDEVVVDAPNTMEAKKLTDADRTDVNKDHKDVTEKPVTQTTQISTVAEEVAQDNSNIPEKGEFSKDDSHVTPSGKPTNKSADENKAVEEISMAGTVAAAAAVEKSEEVLIGADSNTSSSAIVKSTATITTNLDNDGGEPIATAETPVSDGKGLSADVKETSATSTTPSSPTEIATATAAPVTIIPPTLALNDQPMEEQTEPALDDIAVIEAAAIATASSTSSSIAAVAVEEIVMSEASCGATDMATDPIEPTKDEPAGMEVDDTSQEEAMDQ